MKEGKRISATLKVKLSTLMENIPDNDVETVRYFVEQDLQDKGYEVESVEVLD